MVNFNIFCRLAYHLRAYPFDIVPHVICPNGNFTNELCRPVPNTPKNVKNTVRPLPDSTLVSCIKIVAKNVFMSSTLGFIVGHGGLLPFFLLIMFFFISCLGECTSLQVLIFLSLSMSFLGKKLRI